MTTLLKEEEDRARAASSRSRIRWVGKDAQGCPLKRRDRSGATCRRTKDRLLPTGRPSHSCNPEGVTESIGRPLIFVCINGRYDLHLPKRVCNTCHYEWTPDWGDLIRSGYWPASVNGDTLYSTDVFKSFEDLKTVAPGLSRQAFLQMLERRTKHYGRTGKIHGDVFQRSFLEYMACQYECHKMMCEEPFSCPACTPKMLAVSVDGNRKQYRFRLSQRIDEPLFKGPFIMEDSAVTDFVDKVRTNTPGKGTCGTSQWSAARETARKASRLDEEGLEVAAHSTKCEIVWSGRNLEGAGSTAGEEVEMVNSFLSRCAITTKYMTISARNDMLTVHAMGWNRRKQENLHVVLAKRYVKTITMLEVETQKMKDTCEELGCPEDKVQQWVNDVRDWATNDNTSGDNQSLQRSIEQLFLGLCQKKACLYRQTGKRRKRLREEKTKLFAAIRQYNTGQPPETEIQEDEVERRLSAEQQTTDSLIWPWEVQSDESVSILAQKKVFDAYMGKRRLVEERAIIVREMRQHCLYLRSQDDKIRMQMQHVSCGGHSDMTQEGRDGLASLLKKILADVDTHIQHLSSAYSLAIGPNAPQWPDDSVENHDQDSDISDDSEEDPDEDITHTLPPP
ncbi:hypothetical protein CesoFtcFv8_008089 [Champsocephalus esox]|uniref:CxC3 like cysteine cluster domain-containing protein n=1 Tax=Champsocephalus esox TaxID=159716 RepID=A0AAN8CFI3_9TELE|nr:hypothetical protein CesoFtcFv8_008089 [Champsocephalus esox]